MCFPKQIAAQAATKIYNNSAIGYSVGRRTPIGVEERITEKADEKKAIIAQISFENSQFSI
jgi:hypothetical protein